MGLVGGVATSLVGIVMPLEHRISWGLLPFIAAITVYCIFEAAADLVEMKRRHVGLFADAPKPGVYRRKTTQRRDWSHAAITAPTHVSNNNGKITARQ